MSAFLWFGLIGRANHDRTHDDQHAALCFDAMVKAAPSEWLHWYRFDLPHETPIKWGGTQ